MKTLIAVLFAMLFVACGSENECYRAQDCPTGHAARIGDAMCIDGTCQDVIASGSGGIDVSLDFSQLDLSVVVDCGLWAVLPQTADGQTITCNDKPDPELDFVNKLYYPTYIRPQDDPPPYTMKFVRPASDALLIGRCYTGVHNSINPGELSAISCAEGIAIVTNQITDIVQLSFVSP